jgi:CO dehydrogenase maturation factor
VRGVLGGLVAETSRTTIVDLEAGLEHLSRGTARHVDTLLVVGEPYFKSLETASRSFALARDLGIKQIRMIANKVRTPRDEETVRDFGVRHGLPLAAVVPFDEAVVAADEHGAALIEYRPAAPSVASIRQLAADMLGHGASPAAASPAPTPR